MRNPELVLVLKTKQQNVFYGNFKRHRGHFTGNGKLETNCQMSSDGATNGCEEVKVLEERALGTARETIWPLRGWKICR